MQPSSQQALSDVQGFQKSMVNPDQALQSAQSELGVTAAQDQVKGIRGAIQRTNNLLTQVAPSVMGRTQGSLVTNAQANRQIANETAPIQSDLGNLTNDYNTANTDYNQLSDKASTRANAKISGQQNQLSYLQKIYDTVAAQEQQARDEAYRQSQAAEQKRQFDVSEANKLTASKNSGLDLSSLFSSLNNPAPAAPDHAKTAVASIANNPNPFVWSDFLKDANNTFLGGKASYGQLANWLETNLGTKVQNGTAADLALRNLFLGTPLSNTPAKVAKPTTAVTPQNERNYQRTYF